MCQNVMGLNHMSLRLLQFPCTAFHSICSLFRKFWRHCTHQSATLHAAVIHLKCLLAISGVPGMRVALYSFGTLSVRCLTKALQKAGLDRLSSSVWCWNIRQRLHFSECKHFVCFAVARALASLAGFYVSCCLDFSVLICFAIYCFKLHFW